MGFCWEEEAEALAVTPNGDETDWRREAAVGGMGERFCVGEGA